MFGPFWGSKDLIIPSLCLCLASLWVSILCLSESLPCPLSLGESVLLFLWGSALFSELLLLPRSLGFWPLLLYLSSSAFPSKCLSASDCFSRPPPLGLGPLLSKLPTPLCVSVCLSSICLCTSESLSEETTYRHAYDTHIHTYIHT